MTPSTHPVLVVMGVSGTGKSTVAAHLAARLDWPFQEGDALHPAENIAKMAAGIPLDDDDRAPWLTLIAAWIDERRAAAEPGIITCSALRRRYRDVLRRDDVTFVHVDGDPAVILERMQRRQGHFMPTGLLDSQLATLEPPGPDESAVRVDVALPPHQQASEVLAQLGLEPPSDPS